MRQIIPMGVARVGGMTLIELLVALLLMSILSVGILSALRSGHGAYARVVRSGKGMEDVAATQRLLRDLIESAHPLIVSKNRSGFGLEGTRNLLRVSAPMPQAAGAQGLYRYELSLAERADGEHNLVVRYGLDRDGQAVGKSLSAHSGATEEVLLEHVRDVRYDYLAQPMPDRSGVSRPPRWSPDWHQPTLPLLVRLTVEFEPADPRVWPEFLAAPRLTQDAQCVFDLISGACRETP